MRDRLIELIELHSDDRLSKHIPMTSEGLADYLLAKGVIVPPCKVGDKVYVVDKADIKKPIKQRIVSGFEIGLVYMIKTLDTMWQSYSYHFEQFGKTVFLTREEAKQALKGGEGE
jgi:hypothetical protein